MSVEQEATETTENGKMSRRSAQKRSARDLPRIFLCFLRFLLFKAAVLASHDYRV